MKAFIYGVRYHYYAELFDRQVSDLRSPHGNAMPCNQWEFYLMNDNAKKVQRELYEEAAKAGISDTQVHEAIKEAALYSFEELEKLMSRYAIQTDDI